ncbi:hypothetical protein B6U79_02265 [Candidatus Bathyarchaeota archaeon ex4484_231]|nr:MAG: hypothetical protein B6U79_02265 [Candidatus Bathyarchaeota archaeon ex4484_231]RJS75631.1 MAG: hypothetical protein CW712_03970 [Candidatus Bathyarchaeota archaeon]
MAESRVRTLNAWHRIVKTSVLTGSCGILLALASGLVENPPEAAVIGSHHYGFPFVWRVVMSTVNGATRFMLSNLVLDMLFWAGFSLGITFLAHKMQQAGLMLTRNRMMLVSALFLPAGFVMDLLHEAGHLLWGTAVGGRLAYMQVAFFVFYPQFAVTSQFVLGYVRVTGLTSDFARGLFLLGGSLTTNIAAWVLGVILAKVKFNHWMTVTLKMLGLFGVFDLPFYVFLPFIGLKHWIFLGGTTSEPLVGARLMGVADPVFYLFTAVTTVGLFFLYSQGFRNKIKHLWIMFRSKA